MWHGLRTAWSWLTVRAAATGQGAVSLVGSFLSGVLWIISGSYLPLAQAAFGQNAVVYACLRLLTQAVAEPPLLAYSKGQDGTLTPLAADHPLQRLIDRPNELMTGFEMVELIELHQDIAGRSHWWIERDRLATPMALWPLRPDRVGPIYSSSTRPGERVLSGWAYHTPGSGEVIRLPRRDVLSFNFPDPAGETGGLAEGLAPLQVLAREVSADNEATNFVGALLGNYAQPGILLKLKAPIPDKATALRIKEQFRHEFGGPKRGMPAVIDGDAEIEQLSFDLKQLEFPDLREIAETRICAAFGVPAILVGLRSGLKQGIRATIREQREYFTETTLSARWKRYSDQFTVDLAQQFGPDLVCQFDMTKVMALAEQRAEEIKPIAEAFSRGAVTLDQYLARLGVPVPDGVDPHVYYVPAGVTVTKASELGERTPPPALPPPPEPEPEPAERRAPAAVRTAVRADDGAALSLVLADLTRARIAANGTESLARLFDEILARVIERYGILASADDVDAVIAEMLTEDDDALIAALLAALALWAAQDAWTDAASVLAVAGRPTELRFDAESDAARATLSRMAGRVSGINQTTRTLLRASLAAGLSNDETVAEITDRLRTLSAFGRGRAATIVETEVATAYGLALADAYEAAGVERVVISDGDYDPACAEVDGQEKTLAWYRANPIEHPNCTRKARPVVGAAESGTAT